jgi:hypothetical protein
MEEFMTISFDNAERAETLFRIALLPRVCKHHNSAVIEHTEKVEHVTFDNGDQARHVEHCHYTYPRWCSVYTFTDGSGDYVTAHAENVELRGFNPHNHREVMAVFCELGVYRVYADSTMLRFDKFGLCTDSYIVHLTRTETPEVGSRWRPFVRGHAGNSGWSGYLNTSLVYEIGSSVTSLSDLLNR